MQIAPNIVICVGFNFQFTQSIAISFGHRESSRFTVAVVMANDLSQMCTNQLASLTSEMLYVCVCVSRMVGRPPPHPYLHSSCQRPTFRRWRGRSQRGRGGVRGWCNLCHTLWEGEQRRGWRGRWLKGGGGGEWKRNSMRMRMTRRRAEGEEVYRIEEGRGVRGWFYLCQTFREDRKGGGEKRGEVSGQKRTRGEWQGEAICVSQSGRREKREVHCHHAGPGCDTLWGWMRWCVGLWEKIIHTYLPLIGSWWRLRTIIVFVSMALFLL